MVAVASRYFKDFFYIEACADEVGYCKDRFVRLECRPEDSCLCLKFQFDNILISVHVNVETSYKSNSFLIRKERE